MPLHARSRPLAVACATALVAGALVALPAAHAATGGCTVTYRPTNDWGGGATVEVTVTNHGTTLTGWTLGWTFPGNQQVTSGWNGTYQQSGAAVTVRNADWNATVAEGASVGTGFSLTYSGGNPAPTAFTLNGAPCTGPTTSTPPASPTPTPTVDPTVSPTPTPTGDPTPTDPPGIGRVTRQGTRLLLDGAPFRFGGVNLSWLGLDENVGGIAYPSTFRIDDGLDTAKAMGATVVRSHTLGISTAHPLTLEPKLGQFNDQAFATIDHAVAAARSRGLHLVVPLTDNWHWYHGGRHDFTDWLGLPEDAFYTDPRAIAAFETYIDHLLNHVNPYTGTAFKDEPAVLAWELGNELTGVNTTWIRTISAHLKQLSPRTLVASHWSGQEYGVDEVDIVDAHYYPFNSADQIRNDARDITSHGKVYLAGEYGSTDVTSAKLDPLTGDGNVTGALFWQIFPHRDDFGYVQHNDGYTLHYPGDDATMRGRADAIRRFQYAMSGRAVPPVPAPGAPRLTTAQRTGGGVALAWRGSTTAARYTVRRSTTGADGPWTTICDRCASDNDTPWTDTTAPGTAAWYQVTGYTADGVGGPASAALKIGEGTSIGTTLYDFESGVDGWSGTGVAGGPWAVTDWATSGRQSVKADLTLGARTAYLARTGALNLSGRGSLRLSAKLAAWGNAGGGVQVKVYVKTGPSWAWHDGGPQPLTTAGSTLTLDLTGLADLGDVREVGVQVVSPADSSGGSAVYVDNVTVA
ncbi:cellulose binding domain-containing protein [Micromonospora mirobrigensis]|uniref:Cellulase (Glycosyl hydrolase family 5) n=1 Tax=Micromonospora mirobrigensis TaxID=262898 RepID=A0A1C5AB09_9ACTN|nr:cellulose binding domain-containing protein [Micromonospora mirobrigensis]SCF42385.1 Cellulase (glycosyl hydrolase family 5) [Micromonospora mirobrigensis]